MECQYCNKILANVSSLNQHITSSKKCRLSRGEDANSILIKELQNQIKELVFKNSQSNLVITEYNNCIKSKDEVITQLAQQLEQKDRTIDRLNRKKSRVQCPEQNVVYILTTPSLKKNNTYIVGKAINLTTRLSTYNKSEEHEVVYYKQCKDECLLNTTENVILSKLTQYKHQGNRDRFTLPKDTNISLFTDIFNNCVKFLND
jgi:tRNA/tmRNA/rRNA uracil-C5-methylase (TrmA/RlmC/RlmD family)